MGSMYSKLRAENQEERKTFMRDIVIENDPRYFIVTKDGKMIASGEIEEIKEQLGMSYSITPIKYWRHDVITDTVKVIV